MIRVETLRLSTKEFRSDIDVGEVSELCGDTDLVIWADVRDPSEADFELLSKEFGFHHLSIEDCRHQHQRPKIEEYPGYYFIVLYEPELREESLELRELALFLGERFLVTVHPQPIVSIELARALWRQWLDLATQKAGLPAYLLVDAIVDRYLPLIDELTDRADVLEDQIFGTFEPTSIEQIFHTKKQLLYLRRSIAPLRDVFNAMLRREQPIISRETTYYFQDVFDHILRAADSIDGLRELIGSIMDAYLSVAGNRMNMVMKRLTSISTILMSVTLVAGVYGMNFHFMPELGWKYGYVYAIGSMVAVGLGLYYFLRKIKWL